MFDRQSLLFKDIKARGVLKLADVLRLRRDCFPRGDCNEGEAQALLALNAACPVQDMAWAPFLVEMVGAHVVHGAPPAGYVTSANARWLIGHAAKAGRVESRPCLDLVIAVLEGARWSPPSLSAFALRQIELAILTGTGPLRAATNLTRGRVGAGEVDLMRRILAAGGRDSDAITRAEAEVLLDIHDATASAGNCVAWAELLTKAIANLLMTASGYAAPPRAQALRPEPWLDPASPPAEFAEAMTARGFRDVLGAYGARTAEEQALALLDHQRIEIITAEPIAELEAAWLVERMTRAPALLPARALLAYLRQDARALHPALQPLLDKAA